MANVFDYLKWRGDLTFAQDPVNAVDALIFSSLVYIRYGAAVQAEPDAAITLRAAAEDFFAEERHEGSYRVKNDLELLHTAADTVRFGLTRVCMYRDQLVPEQETQFAAVTFLLDDGSMFLAFRGTDGTLTGWKEDFNMSFQQTVPSQHLAARYVREADAAYQVPMRMGGHSKGGNLAVFAAARSPAALQSRILEVYNNDGPGFTDFMMGDPGYLAIVPRIRTYIPQSSVIGMLLEHEEPYTVIRSKTVGPLQHDPYSWEVQGNRLVTVQEVTYSSQFMDATIKARFAEMSDQERGQLVDVMFGLLETGSVDKAADIFHPKNLRVYLKTLSSDENLRRVLSTEFQGLIEAAKKTRAHLEAQQDLPVPPEE